VIDTSPSSGQDAVILELEKIIPELQEVPPKLNPGHLAFDAENSCNASRQGRRKDGRVILIIMAYIIYIPLL
jgi:hypothetical protein